MAKTWRGVAVLAAPKPSSMTVQRRAIASALPSVMDRSQLAARSISRSASAAIEIAGLDSIERGDLLMQLPAGRNAAFRLAIAAVSHPKRKTYARLENA